MKLLNIVCTHIVIAYQAPKSYRKYICYCIKNCKKPDTSMLLRLAYVAYVARQLK